MSSPVGVPLGSGRAGHVPPKAALLDRARAADLPVPPGLVLDGSALTNDTATVARHLGAAMPLARVAVRSAFAAEDGVTASGAGRFRTVLDVDVSDPEALRGALDDVLASAEGTDGDRAVLVQRMVVARHAGVAFLEPDFEDDLVDVVEGLAEDLVAGRVAGDRLALPRVLHGESVRDGWQGRLQTLLRAVRAEFGDERPGWDVEWADDGTTCWLVQVRPITAPPRRNEALTLANHREILPDPPSRFMTSLIVDAESDAYGYWQRFAPDLPSNRPFAEVHAERPLLNLSLLVDTMRRLGLPTRLVTDSMGGSAADLPEVGPRPRRLLAHGRALVGLGVDQLRAPANAARTIASLDRRTRVLDGGFAATIDVARDVYVELLHTMFALSTAVAGPLAVLQLLGVSAEHHARHRSAGTAVWDDLAPLRDLVAADPSRRRAVEDGRVPSDATFQVAWQAFLDQHGHRGIHESDLAQPRYHEDPRPLLATLLVDDRRGTVPPRTLLGRLSAPLWWQAARAIRAREELRSGAMRAFDRLRQRLLALAEEAAGDGRLPTADDLWLCTVDELRALDHGERVRAAHLDGVRARLDRHAELRLPDVVRRHDDPLQWSDDDTPATGRLRGLPLTGGEVRGTVWRLDRPSHEEPPVDGTVVVVAPAVDAGWISTFARADAVVVETGGELSHGSIILRERGVPAVTNVAGATRLTTGQRVTVRADVGVVEIV